MIKGTPAQTRTAHELLDDNRRFYNLLWAGARLIEAEHFNTWPLAQSLLPLQGRQLEVAPGLRPRLPINGTQFVDISSSALMALQARGADVVLSEVSSLPFADATFELVCALDIIEHVDDEDGALAELSRVAASGATLIVSTPLHPLRWNSFDDFVGHKRRYEPAHLVEKLAQHDFIVERTAAFGMQPRSSRLLDLGMWWLTHHREHAMWWYNKVFMRLGLHMQSPLRFAPGMIPTDTVDEILLVCRRGNRALAPPAASSGSAA
jgi:SAM-dependent methyltransferase